MKVLLFSEGMNLIKISGLGRAIMHQQRAMELNGIEYTLDPKSGVPRSLNAGGLP